MSSNFTAKTTADEVAQVFADQIKGKNVIVTGTSPESLGAEAARVIAKYASLVVITGRDQSKVDKTAAEIKAETPSANLRTLIFDLASFESVREAAVKVNAYSEPIHVLINNAALMAPPYALSVEGFESSLAANHLGPFLFTSLIFPKLLSAASPEFPARVVNISSWGHNFSPFRFDDYNFDNGKTYDKWKAYGQTKTANILFANEVARRATKKGLNVVAYSLHPGSIVTPLFKHTPDQEYKDMGYMAQDGTWLAPMKTTGEGAATHIVAAFDPSIISQSGAYLDDAKISDARAEHAKSEAEGKRLWELSEKLVGSKFEI